MEPDPAKLPTHLPLAFIDRLNLEAREVRGRITASPEPTQDGVIRRSCGPCDECCHALTVEPTPLTTTIQTHEFLKPPGEPCPHGANTCRIYAHRPLSCRGYACLWVMGWGEERDRPDRSGIIVDNYMDAAPAMLLDKMFGPTPVCFATEARAGVFPPKGARDDLTSFPNRTRFPEPLLSMSDERAILLRWYGDGHPDLVIGPEALVKRFKAADAEWARRGM